MKGKCKINAFSYSQEALLNEKSSDWICANTLPLENLRLKAS
jgi:hypothetical protein